MAKKRTSLKQRFDAKWRRDPSTGCWEWTASKFASGYGSFSINAEKRGARAHRVAYELYRKPVPEGMVLDHKCRNPACVNPDHLDIVTQKENVSRGLAPAVCGENNRIKTECPKGHPYTGENLYENNGRRVCRACQRIHQRAYMLRKSQVMEGANAV